RYPWARPGRPLKEKSMRNVRKRTQEQGHSIMEFALIAWPTVIMIFGVVVIGIDLGRSVQVTQICRDAGSMYVRGLDFSQSGNEQVLVRLGQNMNLQVSGGDGLVTLSKVTFIPDTSCGSPPDPNCTAGK